MSSVLLQIAQGSAGTIHTFTFTKQRGLSTAGFLKKSSSIPLGWAPSLSPREAGAGPRGAAAQPCSGQSLGAGSANSPFGFCTQKTLCAQLLLSNPAPVQQGQNPPRRDLLPLPMEGNRAELGFLSHGHNRHVLNGVH